LHFLCENNTDKNDQENNSGTQIAGTHHVGSVVTDNEALKVSKYKAKHKTKRHYKENYSLFK
tara:strand:+ start:99 stop:284 length:186 start_codon:yes stop_codon:yes gene_type:complete